MPDAESQSDTGAKALAYTINNVFFAYNGLTALRGLSLNIKQGERVALLGANGSGKSTLLRLLAGLSFPLGGEIYFDGEPLTAQALEPEEAFYRFRRRVGIVFQNPDVQLFNPSVFDEVAFGPLQLRWHRAEVRERVEQTLQELGLLHLADRPPHRLSGGEKKRVALASVLVTDPAVLLLDEPTSALDPASQTQTIEMLSSWAGTPRTVVIATHDLSALERISDRCVLLSRGALAAEGETLEILHDVPLLERAELIRRQLHRHANGEIIPHGHFHVGEN
jgi:cobalt/nickel transport system ATP-binding protein